MFLFLSPFLFVPFAATAPQGHVARCSALLHRGRPGGNRTPNLRFWRPPLCQLSYWPFTSLNFSGLGDVEHVGLCAFGRSPYHPSCIRGETPLLHPTFARRGELLQHSYYQCLYLSFNDLRHHARTHGPATLTDCKPQTIFHRDRCNQVYHHLHVISRHHHLGALG